MGTYTGLRMKILLNDHGMEVVKAYYLAELACAADYAIRGYHKDVHESWRLLAPQFPEIKAWIDAGLAAYKPDCEGHTRVQSIPGGCLSSVWGWDEDTYEDAEWGGHRGRLDDRVWTIQAGLKNYWSDINHFLEIVVPAIAEEVVYGAVHYDNCALCYDYAEDAVVDWRVLVKDHPEHEKAKKEQEKVDSERQARQDKSWGWWP